MNLWKKGQEDDGENWWSKFIKLAEDPNANLNDIGIAYIKLRFATISSFAALQYEKDGRGCVYIDFEKLNENRISETLDNLQMTYVPQSQMTPIFEITPELENLMASYNPATHMVIIVTNSDTSTIFVQAIFAVN